MLGEETALKQDMLFGVNPRAFLILGGPWIQLDGDNLWKGRFQEKCSNFEKEHIALGYCLLVLDNWANRLVLKLLDATYGQWLYSNIEARDSVVGRQQVPRK